MHIHPTLPNFKEKYRAGKPQLVWAVLSADLETPVSALLKLKQDDFICLFESVHGGEVRGRYSFIALEPDMSWSCLDGESTLKFMDLSGREGSESSNDPFSQLRQIIKESSFDIPASLPPMASGLFGYMSWDMVRLMEELGEQNKDVLNVPDAYFVRARVVLAFDHVKDEIMVITSVFPNGGEAESVWENALARIHNVLEKLDQRVPRMRYEDKQDVFESESTEYTSNTTKDEYLQMVEKAKEYIAAGDIFQVVLSQRFSVNFEYSPVELYRALRRLNPSPFSFFMQCDGFSLVGSSPEILVRLRDNKVTVRPIAGTRKRGENNQEDRNLAEDLLKDPKELAEHLMLLDLGRNDVGRVAKGGSVSVTEQMMIEYYSHVMHIVSNVEGDLAEGKDALDALIAGFPAGTTSGAPKIRAMEIIDELEKEKRNYYAGCVGYFSANGSMDTCIALRTGLIKDKTLYVQAGGGIVADSNPEDEYQESCNKAKALLKAAELAVNFVEE